MKDLLIVVPYRNREEHLKKFLEKTPKYFEDHGITYDILICELDQQGDWNAGLCCNSIIEFINEQRKYKYVFIHHVDIFPIDGEWEFPKSKQIFSELGDYGSCVISLEDFLLIRGYCNGFWGWGGEDNDFYFRAKNEGIAIVDSSKLKTKFNTEYQNHERTFNGTNYACAIKNISVTKEGETNNIVSFSEHGYTKNLNQLKNNIYHHIVVPKKTSPRYHKNNKVILTFSKGIINFEEIAFYIKSACIFSSYEFDVVVVVGDEHPDSFFLNQIEIHGAKTFLPKIKCTNLNELFIDRFQCYKEFLLQNKQYEYVLHTDFTDTYFQSNPFNSVILNKLNFACENVIIKDETWNINILDSLYSEPIVSSIKNNNVICGGVIYGPVSLFLQLCDSLHEEYNKILTLASRERRGIDQPILNKLIYFNKIFQEHIVFKEYQDEFCINLHSVKYHSSQPNFYPIQINNRSVLSPIGFTYAIVHQFNRYPEFFNKVKQHYIKYYNLF